MLALWLGVMKIGERAGMVNWLARGLSPVFTRLFPDIPKGHPATGSIFMNISANMLGLDNAATPLGLKAMEQMQELNTKKDTASNPMIMFLVLNTSGLTIIPVSILSYRAQQGAAQPTDVFIPILLATIVATLAGIIVTSIYQKINLFNRTLLLTLGGVCLFMAAVVWGFMQLDAMMVDKVSISVASVLLLLIIVGFIVAGMMKRINVYEAFIDGAKDGFTTAVRIIPYLVAFLVGIAVFRASGATGSGARGMMLDAMTQYGPDSFVGRLSCLFQGSTDTTFYILAVYFGSVSIKYTRHAVTCGLLADLAGVIAAIALAYMFF